MITAKELISKNIPIGSPLEQGEIILNWMDTYKIVDLPIVENNKLIAIISETDIYNLNEFQKPIGDYKLGTTPPYIFDHQHIYDVINIMVDKKLSLLPVLDENKDFIGSIIIQDLLPAIKQITSIDTQGGIIVLEIEPTNYSLTEIANIIESENGKVVSLYLNNNISNNTITVNIKINLEDLNPIIKSFERYNYNLKVSYCSNSTKDSFYEDRYNELMHYLNI